jgi:hypothetical protein
MFELHVVVAGIIMFNIIELIMEIVSNYPTTLIQVASMFKLERRGGWTHGTKNRAPVIGDHV